MNLPQSHGTAIILLLVYAAYLFFQLRTHVSMYNEPSSKGVKRKESLDGSVAKGIATIGANSAATLGGAANSQAHPLQNKETEEEDDFEEPNLTMWGALITLAISTTLVAFCSEFMVSSIDGFTREAGISTTFVGLILLPIVGNAAEHATAVTVAIKDKMDLSIGVAVGSSMQIALLVLPGIVVIGWIAGKEDMTLYFDTFQIAILFVAVLLVNYLIQDGKSRKCIPYHTQNPGPGPGFWDASGKTNTKQIGSRASCSCRRTSSSAWRRGSTPICPRARTPDYGPLYDHLPPTNHLTQRNLPNPNVTLPHSCTLLRPITSRPFPPSFHPSNDPPSHPITSQLNRSCAKQPPEPGKKKASFLSFQLGCVRVCLYGRPCVFLFRFLFLFLSFSSLDTLYRSCFKGVNVDRVLGGEALLFFFPIFLFFFLFLGSLCLDWTGHV